MLAQHALEVFGGAIADVEQLLLAALGFSLLFALGVRFVFDDVDACALCQLAYRLDEIQTGRLLHELDGVAGRVAAEAMIEAGAPR